MAKPQRSVSKQRQGTAQPSQARARISASKASTHTQVHSGQSNASHSNSGQSHAGQPRADQAYTLGQPQSGWAADLVFDVREPKLAVSLRLDADVLRFFRGFGAGYQTRINEVLKAFMHAREGMEIGARIATGAKASRAMANGKRAR